MLLVELLMGFVGLIATAAPLPWWLGERWTVDTVVRECGEKMLWAGNGYWVIGGWGQMGGNGYWVIGAAMQMPVNTFIFPNTCVETGNALPVWRGGVLPGRRKDVLEINV